MSTRCQIIRHNQDNSFDSIYCHHDGYFDGVGKTLTEHYTDPQKVDQLISLGNISSLAPNIGTKHDFNDPPRDECNAYERDRGESNQAARHFISYALISGHCNSACAQYVYVFSRGEWLQSRGVPKPSFFEGLKI